jgi:hypothetical protein
MPNRWFNSRLPQTLVISQFLLYFDAFYAFLDVISSRRGVMGPSALGRLLLLLALGGYIYGAWGIANEKKQGYQVAVAASFMPLAARFISTLSFGGPLEHISYVLLGGGLIGALFEYALIGLLLHQQSREHQRVWFD